MGSSSKQWLAEHRTDIYVKRAAKEGYPSRAAYKLLEIQQKYTFMKPGMTVLDLGAAPGGWSMVAQSAVGNKGKVIASDLLPMVVPPGVIFIQGDFNETSVLEALVTALGNHITQGQADLVISDMAPNLSGMSGIDQPRAMHLVDLAWDCAQKVLKPGGSFLTKVFQGAGSDDIIKELRIHFAYVKILKPQASRPRSREIYVLGFNKK